METRKLIDRFCRFFTLKKNAHLTLCTRQPAKAKELLEAYDIEIVDWSVIPHWLAWDVIICGTQHHDYLLKQEHSLDNFGFSSLNETHVIFDLSVPRNVDPQLAQHLNIALYNMEQLSQIIDTKRRHHLGEIDAAHELVLTSVERQLKIYNEKLTRRLICTG